MATLENYLGGKVLPVVYFFRHDMIKTSASTSLVLMSAIALIFSLNFFKTVAAILFSADFTPACLYSFSNSYHPNSRYSTTPKVRPFPHLRGDGTLDLCGIGYVPQSLDPFWILTRRM